MDTLVNPFIGRIAVSRARSFLAYQHGMSRHSLMKQLAIRLSPQAGKSLVMRGSLRIIPKWFKQASREADARKNEFPKVS